MLVNYSETLDTTFSALADPTRRAILAQLATGQCSIGELAAPFDISLPAISRHVRVLEDAGLLVRQRDGRVHRCQLDPEPMRAANSWLEEMRHFWESRFDALADFLEEMEDSPSWPQPQPQLPKASKSGERSPRRARKSSAPGRNRRR